MSEPGFEPRPLSPSARALASWNTLNVRLSIKLPHYLRMTDRVALRVRKDPRMKNRG